MGFRYNIGEKVYYLRWHKLQKVTILDGMRLSYVNVCYETIDYNYLYLINIDNTNKAYWVKEKKIKSHVRMNLYNVKI